MNYILNDGALDNLIIKCLYADPTKEDMAELKKQIELIRQENKEYKKYIKRLDELNARDFILKSVIRDKIEELERLEKNPKEAKHYRAWYLRRIEILKEILEE